MKRIAVIVVLLACVPLIAHNAPPTGSAAIERELRRHQGDATLYCALVDALLQEGDTVTAEQRLSYALKLAPQDTSLNRLKVRLALDRSHHNEAVQTFVTMIGNGYRTSISDTLLIALSQCCYGSLRQRLDILSKRDKTGTTLYAACASLAILREDTATAVQALTIAEQRGDILAADELARMRTINVDSITNDSVKCRIQLTRTRDGFELQGKVNGLKMKIAIDTTATISTISGVESTFMLKNDYAKSSDIIRQTQLLLHTIAFDEGITLREVLVHNRNGQEQPLILSLQAFNQLGKVTLNEKNNAIEIR